jgi:hypothetical protein
VSCSAPHLGTDNLVRLLRNMRADLRSMGGEIHFNTRCVSSYLLVILGNYYATNRLAYKSDKWYPLYRVNKFHIEDGTIKGVDATCTPSSERGEPPSFPADNELSKSFWGDAVVLATGHSARDIYYELHDSGVELEAKGFAVGFRVEHPQVYLISLTPTISVLFQFCFDYDVSIF